HELNPFACRSAFTAFASFSNPIRDINPSTWLNKLLERTIAAWPPSVVGLDCFEINPNLTSEGVPLILIFSKSYFGQDWSITYDSLLFEAVLDGRAPQRLS